nr:prolyl oligopeptidase family serine peptidase [uncultured Pseudoxanthomonas sp.]
MVRQRRRGVIAVLVVLLGLSAVAAQASMREVEPGSDPALKASEGLVLMAVDTPVPVYSVRMNRDGKIFGSGAMRQLKAGRSFRLYAVPAGTYGWRELQMIYGYSYKLADDEDFRFKVEPGRITYPGDLLFRPTSVWRAQFAMANRALAAIDWLTKEHAAIYAHYPFEFAGRYPDPFPAFYRAIQESVTQDDAVADLGEPPAPSALPLPVATLFKRDRILEASINPAGTLLALHVREGEDDWGVDLIDLNAGQAMTLAKSALAFDRLQWSGDDMLLLAIDKPRGLQMVTVVRIEQDAAGRRRYTQIKLPRDGVIVDPLPADPAHILFASYSNHGEPMVHRLPISSQQAVDGFRFAYRDRVNQGLKDDVGWYTDGSGELRLVMVRGEDHYRLLRKEDIGFREVLVLTEDMDFEPVALSRDASVVYGFTEKNRGQRDLVEYDLAKRVLTRTLFTRPGHDVRRVLFDARRAPIGVQYYEGGKVVSHYFQSDDAHMEGLLQKAFPGRLVQLLDRNRDGRHAVLSVDGPDQPPQLFHLDAAAGRVALIDDFAPSLAEMHFAPAEVLRVTHSDGTRIEAFLTLPDGRGKRPLVVMPHGGPIGVADSLHFDREVQFIASLGYAVLQVNFRGSEGYGKAFREGAYRGHGTVIEDDIDAALQHALSRYPLDADRMCMMGASYGGYSSLVAAVRWPDRFRCVVSISGVSDRVLFFTASDSARRAKTREHMEKTIGNPHTDLVRMQETSPLYQYARIRTPVMLVHGLEDERVDYEHSRRLARMMRLGGHPAVGLVFEDEGHGFDSQESQEKSWAAVAGFLQKHLGGTDTAAKMAVAP